MCIRDRCHITRINNSELIFSFFPSTMSPEDQAFYFGNSNFVVGEDFELRGAVASALNIQRFTIKKGDYKKYVVGKAHNVIFSSAWEIIIKIKIRKDDYLNSRYHHFRIYETQKKLFQLEAVLNQSLISFHPIRLTWVRSNKHKARNLIVSDSEQPLLFLSFFISFSFFVFG